MAILSYLWLWFGPYGWVWLMRSNSKCSWEAPFQHRHASFPSLDARIRDVCGQSAGVVGVTQSHIAVHLQHLRKAQLRQEHRAHTKCDAPLHNSTPIFLLMK